MHEIWTRIRDFLPTVVGALVILLIGWIVARIIGRIVAVAIRRSGLERRLRPGAAPAKGQPDAAAGVGRVVYYFLLLFVVIAFLQALGLTLVTAPLSAFLAGVFLFLPRLIGAAILAVIAWIVARVVRRLVLGAARSARLDERLGAAAAEPGLGAAAAPGAGISEPLALAAYGLVWLLFLPMILGALGLTGLLAPVQALITEIFAFLPRLISAALLVLIGWFVARLVGRIVAGLLAAAGLDRLGARLGFAPGAGGPLLSSLVGTLVFILILLPVATAALDTLGLAAVAQPVSHLLDIVLLTIPRIIVAAMIVAVAVVVGRVVARIVGGLLTGLGFDAFFARLGLGPAIAGGAPSFAVGGLVYAALVWLAAIQALQILGFAQLTALASQLAVLAGHILLGLVIFLAGLWLARAAARAVRASGGANAGALARTAQGGVLFLFGAMALRQMGVADQIVGLAFGLVLAAAAVAAALAFGLGGRAAAGRQLERWTGGALPGPFPPPDPGGPTV